jgi:GTPase
MDDPTPTPPGPRSGIVAVIGATNVGKSTLINALVGEKVSIVSPVVQTTRNIIRAILTEPRGQLVLMDTPGVHKASYELGRLMNKMARRTAVDVDAALLVLDRGRPPAEEDEGWMRRLMRPDNQSPLLIVLNKADLKRDYADAYRERWNAVAAEKAANRPATWLDLSARLNTGVDHLRDQLFALLPPGPLLFPEDMLTDYPRKLTIGDVIREKYVVRLKEELPHAIAVWIETIDEKENGWTAHGTVYVNKHSQKGIVLGAKGRLLKTVVAEAEKECAELYGHPVRLKLWVKVEKDWARNFWMLKKLGYA